MKKLLLVLIIMLCVNGCSAKKVDNGVVSNNEKEISIKENNESIVETNEETINEYKQYSLKSAKEGIMEGDIAKNIICQTKQEEEFDLSKQKGKVVLINMWATWCPPCVAEMPAFEKLNNELDKNKFTMVAISNENKNTIDEFIDENKYTFPVGYDDENSSIMMDYEVISIPLTVIVNQEGIIVKKFLGAVSADVQYREYMKVINSLLE